MLLYGLDDVSELDLGRHGVPVVDEGITILTVQK